MMLLKQWDKSSTLRDKEEFSLCEFLVDSSYKGVRALKDDLL